MRRPRSIQGLLLALVIGLVGATWLIVAVMTWFDMRHELDELLDGHLAQAAALLVVQQGPEPDDDRVVDAPSLHKYAPKVAFQVFHEGKLVSRSARAPVQPMIGRGGAPLSEFRSGFHDVLLDGVAWRVFAAHGAERDVQVYVGELAESRMDILFAAMRSALWPMLAALPVLAVLLWWAVRQGLLPLRALGDALAHRGADDLQPLRIHPVASEMVPLLAALNALFGRIETLIESERRFTADAAHELRTPIAAIRAQAQVALGEADADNRAHALNALLAGCDRATRLVDQMLQLARLEAGAPLPLANLDLVPIAREVLAVAATGALRAQQDLVLDGVARADIRADAMLLSVLLRNLVDNAIRYSPTAARIRVAIRTDAHTVALSVEDSGPGLDEAAIGQLGQRFRRGPGAEATGSGLGWSIVQRIAALHGARIDVGRSDALGGLRVEVFFPRVEAS